MTRLARRALLLVALSLLTSAATAYAECAWVMWVQTISRSKGEYWRLTEGPFKSLETCKVLTEMYWGPIPDTDVTYRRPFCLPDTIDPREKGGR